MTSDAEIRSLTPRIEKAITVCVSSMLRTLRLCDWDVSVEATSDELLGDPGTSACVTMSMAYRGATIKVRLNNRECREEGYAESLYQDLLHETIHLVLDPWERVINVYREDEKVTSKLLVSSYETCVVRTTRLLNLEVLEKLKQAHDTLCTEINKIIGMGRF